MSDVESVFITTTIQLTPEQLARLDKIAKRLTASRSYLVRQAIREFIERTEAAQPQLLQPAPQHN